ncbi:hypothetical protein ASPACDRAFT_46978 [Aspergillus aculeatus ATCC 16872]|uniref:Anaphase-promoting complex subunit 11 RING-H2 finger domain-containing protein n=1 Tax=Aspergillus aculeatus (strain ATCC 16872 / CBS 172.66 / WB 5094) TaxID=690307 RepID=A0A1L9WJ72_ASPA1|nr:uncharacterized protein ASPACDRAFT_46978 [Aspergillus aculeatus ATCC 16872]OJJ96211.1 hypothetical protein ASPACDRAFT_46978 [Aspergillus aculeatus ATCC 16872]
MSLPKHTTPSPLSSSPSKQSIRRISANHNHLPTSRPQSVIDRPPTAQQHHLENIPDPPPPPPATIPPAPLTDQPIISPTSTSAFQPFFTLIEDANTSEYHHPTVHYIFADDDTDIVTEATLRALESESDPTLAYNPNTRKSHNNKTRSRRPQQQQQQQEEEEEGAQNTYEDQEKGPSLLPDSIPGVREHYVILDVDYALPGGGLGVEEMKEQSGNTTTATAGGEMLATSPPQQQEPHHGAPSGSDEKSMVVTSAHSLSPAWQVLDTQLGPAPTFENNTNNTPSQGQGQQSVNGGLMLKIRGTAGLPINNLLGKERDKERGCQRLEEMMDQFAKRLAELRLVIEAGGLGEQIEDAEVESSPGVKMDEHGVEQGQHENGQDLVEDATAGKEMGL